MAFVSTYCCDDLQHVVYQPRLQPVPPYPTPRFVQVELTISLRVDRSRHYCLNDQIIDLEDEGPFSSGETLRFNLDVLRDHHRAYQVLGPVLRGLLVTGNVFLTLDPIIDDIIRHGLKIENWASNRGREVLILRAELWGTVVEHIEYQEGVVLLERASGESASESGMVPAKESSVKRMLTRVRVEAGECDQKAGQNIEKRLVNVEDCVICLEEFKVGSVALQMPCFHGDCIERCLRQSHYCPVCRIEMPTE
ncbi:uncharacterized protein LOC110428379 [Herrania umbratica]|uniref:RING-type E3 ubiquitin transferase n=1 Tax=Herrania umbratica TaxID=108875 RepID=A0A6J1BNN9_9ROSI|nr:uncharacterized protein LOC110428379 [Herrania umbratica]